MIKRLTALLILVPIGIILIVFSVANRKPVQLSLDPFNHAEPALALQIPLFVLLFVTVLLGMLIGSMATWFKQGKHRKKARVNAAEANKWHHEADREKERSEKLAQEVVARDDAAPRPVSGALEAPAKA